MRSKKLLSLLLALCMVLSWVPVTASASGDVEVNETNFPDENFRNYILDLYYGTDGVLTQEELTRETDIDVSNLEIKDLTGIEYFTSLTQLSCNGNQLTSLDVSRNTALTHLVCWGNQLTSLDVSQNTVLEVLYCQNNQLTNLDVSKNTALTWLACDNNPLTSLDVSPNTALTGLDCRGNQLTSLDISKNTALTSLSCGENQLANLDVSKNPALTWLTCEDNQLTSLDVSKNTALTDLECGSNQLTSLDVSKNTALTWLSCGGNQLTSLDLSQNTALTSLSCYDNQLTSLDVSKNTALTHLACDGNQLTSLDVSRNTALTDLYCGDNRLTDLDVSSNTALETLWCYDNQLTTLDVSKNTALKGLSCDGNQLTDLDVSSNTALEALWCYGNQLTSLDVSRNTALTYLDCGGNQLTSLDVNQNTALTDLWCSSNQLTNLDVSRNTALTALECGYNQLTNLDVSRNTALTGLYCGINQLTDLDVSSNTALEALWCYGNQLTTLDVSRNTALTDLDCGGNQLTSLDVNQNTALTWLYCYANTYSIELDENDQFDLSTLPGGFDVTKASEWTGGTVNGTILTVDGESARVTYTYQLSDSWAETFTLRVKGITRSSGENRYETSVTVADQMKEALGVEKFDAVILANGYNFADALSGSYLASVKDAPILLTWNGSEKYDYLNEYTVDYVKANLKEGGTVYILGGTSAVPETVDAMLEGYNIVRMDGANRFETNIMILEEAGVQPGQEILVCTSTNFADSLSASAAGKPILLVWNEGGKLFDSQKDFLAGLSDNTFCVVGGENAVSAGMANLFSGYGETTRLAGANRFETSVLVAEKYFDSPESAVLAYAWDFPDGLCGGSLAYAMDAPLILTMTNYESQAAEYIQGQGIDSGIVLGGEKLISEESVQIIFAK